METHSVKMLDIYIKSNRLVLLLNLISVKINKYKHRGFTEYEEAYSFIFPMEILLNGNRKWAFQLSFDFQQC